MYDIYMYVKNGAVMGNSKQSGPDQKNLVLSGTVHYKQNFHDSLEQESNILLQTMVLNTEDEKQKM